MGDSRYSPGRQGQDSQSSNDPPRTGEEESAVRKVEFSNHEVGSRNVV